MALAISRDAFPRRATAHSDIRARRGLRQFAAGISNKRKGALLRRALTHRIRVWCVHRALSCAGKVLLGWVIAQVSSSLLLELLARNRVRTAGWIKKRVLVEKLVSGFVRIQHA